MEKLNLKAYLLFSTDEFEAYPHPRFLHRAYLGGGPKYTTDWLILPRSPPFPGYQGVLRPRAPSHHRLGLGGGGFQKRYVDLRITTHRCNKDTNET